MENKRDNRDLITPVRLHAYERAALFLERIMPETIIHRVHQNGMSASLLHEKLLRTIRAEFEHNLSQQVYMSDEAWTRMKNAKEELVKLINLCAVRAGNSASGIELGRLVLGLSMKMNEQPVQAALDFIKKELRKSF